MSSVNVDKSIIKALRGLPKDVRDKALKSSLRVSAKKVQDTAKALAPYRTGNLRDSIAIRSMSKRSLSEYGDPFYFIGYKVGLLPKGYYGRFIELGTKYITPKPFLLPALEVNEYSIISVIITDLRIKIPKFTRKYL